jgi:AcrR family transcriptional regulator
MTPPAALDHENARRILQEAWLLFQQKGYRGVTVDELCLRCGLTKPTLYYYFKDKENLFVEVLQQRLRGFGERIALPGTLAERLERTAAALLEGFQAPYTLLMREREHIRGAENQRAVRDAFRREMLDPLHALMREGLQSGELRGGDPEMLTLVYLGVINNFIGRGEVQIPALAQILTDYFLKGACNHE